MKTKKNSAHNAVRHGIFANIVLDGESFGDGAVRYAELVSVLRCAIQPRNGLEDLLVEKLGFLFLRLTRLYRSDAAIAPKLFAQVSQSLDEGHSNADTVGVDREFETLVIKREPTPELMIRYEVNLERQIARTLDELTKMREMIPASVELLEKTPQLKGGEE